MFNKDKKMLGLINLHYTMELYASNLYDSFATIANKQGYSNLAKFMHKLATDKTEAHLSRVYKYMINLNEILKADENFKMNYSNLESIHVKEMVRKMLAFELEIRKNGNLIADYALAVKDYESFEFIQWFIKDGLKDINDVNRIWDLFNDVDESRMAIESNIAYILDEEDQE